MRSASYTIDKPSRTSISMLERDGAAERGAGSSGRAKQPAGLARLCATAAAATVALVSGPAAADSWRLGVSADVGVPDGGTAAVSVAPISLLRVHAGVSHNSVSPGIRVGATLVPLQTFVTPTLSVDWGRFKEGDANPMARRISGDDSIDSPALERFGYDYANAHVGLEIGRSWTFYLHAGASRVTSVAHGLEAELESMADTGDPSTKITFTEDPKVTAWVPSARIGFIVHLN
jgi:hypothetical protein